MHSEPGSTYFHTRISEKTVTHTRIVNDAVCCHILKRYSNCGADTMLLQCAQINPGFYENTHAMATSRAGYAVVSTCPLSTGYKGPPCFIQP